MANKRRTCVLWETALRPRTRKAYRFLRDAKGWRIFGTIGAVNYAARLGISIRRNCQHAFRHGCDRQAFVHGHIGRGQVAPMDYDPLRLPAPESRTFGDRNMDSRRIHIGDPIHGQCGFVRERDMLGAMTRVRPQDRFPVLRTTDLQGSKGFGRHRARHVPVSLAG
jgi:hypothetical protein